jgi:UDP-glucose 4-epimerase
MNILVTGGAGFIGSHIVDAYLRAGHEVTVVDDLSTGSKKNVNRQARLVTTDVRDPNLSTLFAESRFEVVNHLAAQLDVRKSVQDPFFDASVNILGALRLLECGRTYGVRKFIFSSSGGTYYGECGAQPAREEDPSNPESPYGISKATAERYIQFYGNTYHLPYTILRYANVYGPRQDPHGEAGVVAIFAGKLLAKQAVTIFGDGKQERDYVYVSDVVEANVAALTKGENSIFNVGTGQASSVNALYEKFMHFDKDAKPPTYAPARTGELLRSVLNVDRARKELGWKPSTTLEKGLRETYHYFQQQKRPASTKNK